MSVRLHPHAALRAAERGASEAEVAETVEGGEPVPAQHGRSGFQRDFPGPWTWRARRFDSKRVLAYAVPAGDAWLVITVIVKFRGGAP